jgi:hypothetical protein
MDDIASRGLPADATFISPDAILISQSKNNATFMHCIVALSELERRTNRDRDCALGAPTCDAS